MLEQSERQNAALRVQGLTIHLRDIFIDAYPLCIVWDS